MRSISDEFARRIALDLISARPRSEAELRGALARRNVPEKVIDDLCARFKEVRLLDDAAFAAAVVHSRLRHSLHGSARIAHELRNKGVSDELVAEMLGEIGEEDELAGARELASKKLRSLRGQPLHVAQRRLAGTLSRRGFSQSVVIRVVEEALVDWQHPD
ncbi:regulatory protein RecX [Tessaracoccus sp. OH4464_COT-324]|uniref:regulatory protein RecX n=1 Tax=Tessaracoccus sp. OH4464_COT-324 TaxID=2491059 RepID=UPI000F634688|nr:regulatory protein RecX [Tessaracoccus sp. OH4464_COT-324]RRD47488.1 regulatory protein RecX [Tessaracoccus sp. OH4464_COT-324]